LQSESESPKYFELRSDKENLTDSGSWRQAVFARNGIPYTRTFQEFPKTGAVWLCITFIVVLPLHQILQQFLDKYAKDMPKASMELSVLARL
jgi:hypothetical protein